MSDCILAIVGSCDLTPQQVIAARKIIVEALHTIRPTLVISGAAKGIDKLSVKIADQYGVPWREYPPAARNWPAFKARNIQVGDACTELLRIYSTTTKTYGSGWTRDYVRKQGKKTTSWKLTPDGKATLEDDGRHGLPLVAE